MNSQVKSKEAAKEMAFRMRKTAIELGYKAGKNGAHFGGGLGKNLELDCVCANAVFEKQAA